MVAGTTSTLASIGADPQGVADGTRAVLTASTALSVLAVFTTLLLISPRRVPAPVRETASA
jgi:hypothetical protein